MRDLPFVPFFTADWLASSARVDMTLTQRACYLDLLFHLWDRAGAIPDDETKLAKLAMATPAEFSEAWPEVQKHFVPHPEEPGMLTNEKMLAVIRKQADIHAKKSQAGRAGGIASGVTRKQKQSRPEAQTKHLEPESETESELEIETEREKESARALGSVPSFEKQSPSVNEFLSLYPKNVGQAAARKAYASVITSDTLHSALMEGLARWLRSDQWTRSQSEDGGRYIPNAANFIADRLWAEFPPQANSAKPDPMADALKRIKARED
jgi:uncharacterized protein YdaU (DUF1376 family)